MENHILDVFKYYYAFNPLQQTNDHESDKILFYSDMVTQQWNTPSFLFFGASSKQQVQAQSCVCNLILSIN